MIKKILRFITTLIVLVGVCFGFVMYQMVHPEKVLNEFHQSLKDNDFDRAYDCLSWEARRSVGRGEFPARVVNIIPSEFPKTDRQQLFNGFIKAVEFEVSKKSLFSEQQYVVLKVATPSERAINFVIDRNEDFKARKMRLDALSLIVGKEEIVYRETGRLMADVLDSLLVQDWSETVQFYDVEEIKVNMEFGIWRWKISGAT